MKKSLKVAKMNIRDMLKALVVFYIIVVVGLTGICMAIKKTNGSISGFELTTMIFLFVCGLNSFKENFYFAQGNNISRKSFLTGVIISIFPIGIVMAVIDIIINRILNLFTVVPTIYDLFYSTTESLSFDVIYGGWVQKNDFETLIKTVLLAAIIYVVSYVIGLVITMTYYRSNVFTKILISVLPPAFIISGGMIGGNTGYYLVEFMKDIFGINSCNFNLALISFTALVIILALISKLLINEATIRER